MRKRSTIALQNKNYIIALFSFLALLFSFAGYYFYQHEIKSIKRDRGDELKLIADLKINQISNWYDDEMDDAKSITKNLFFTEKHYKDFLYKDNRELAYLKKQLLSLKEEHGYKDIILVTGDGKIVVATSDTIPSIEVSLLKIIQEAGAGDVTLCSDFYRCSNNDIYIDFISPVKDNTGVTCAIVIYRIDAKKFQFPLISFWPTASKTSETLIVRKEKDSILFINEIRHLKNSALNLKISMLSKDVPAVRAAEGYTGIFEGRDYRGADVFAYLSPVYNTPWFMIAKIDKDELLEDFYLKIWAVIVIVLLFFLFVGMSISYLYTNRQKRIYKTLWQTEEEYRVTLYSIGDAVIITDKLGMVQHLNSAAEKCTGWTEIDAQNEPIEKVFNIINEETQLQLENPVKKILEHGLINGLASNTILISKNGRVIPIADSGAPIRDKNGEITGIVIVFRDQSEERKRQRSLEENDALIRSIMDNLPMGIAVNSVNPDVVFNYMNDNFPKIYRTTREELLKYDTFWECVYEDPVFREEIKKKVLDDCNSGNMARMFWNEIPITRKGQETTYISAHNIPIPDKHLQISTVWDVTDQIKAELAIRENEHKFRSLFENHSSVKLIIDYSDGTIIDANEAAANYYGWTIGELKQMNITQINTLPFERIKEEIEKLETGQNTYFEFKHRLRNGDIRDVELFSSKIEISGKNYLYSIINDTTEKKKAEQQIKLLSRSIEQSPVIVIITDPMANIEYVNPKFERISGYCFEEVKGQNMRIFKSGRHDQAFYKELWNTILSGKDWQGEIQNKKKNGELFWEHSLISPITDVNGNISHFVAAKEDITEKKKMLEDLIIAKEKAEESDRLKTAFLANMSHEIRTPLNGILGFIELLGRPDLTGEQHDRFKGIINKSSDRLLSTINDIIEISKIESGQMQLNKSMVNINEIMQYLLSFFKPEADIKTINFTCSHFLSKKQALFYTDKNKLESVLINLLKNAIKFTIKGSIEFGCFLKNDIPEFFVKDTGAGIPESKQQVIFNRFVQGNTSVTKPHEGSGLGLSISKAYIEKLGGKIWIKSKPGIGTTFYFNIANSQSESYVQI
jgi:PAS domain S-box-containing protein